MEYIQIIKELSNIMFFIGVPLVALLTFLHAKGTVFNTHKNEVFKVTLKEYERILSLLYISDIEKILSRYELREIIKDNTKRIVNDYKVLTCDISLAEYEEIESKYKNIIIFHDGTQPFPSRIKKINIQNKDLNLHSLYGLHVGKPGVDFYDELERMTDIAFIKENNMDRLHEIKDLYYNVRMNIFDFINETFRANCDDKELATSQAWLEYSVCQKLIEHKETVELFESVKSLCNDIRKEIDLENIMK